MNSRRFGAVRVAALLNPANPNTETVARGVESAARAMALQMRVYEASTIGEIDAAFAALARERSDALFVAGDPVFRIRRVQLALLATHYRVPAIYSLRDFAEAAKSVAGGNRVRARQSCLVKFCLDTLTTLTRTALTDGTCGEAKDDGAALDQCCINVKKLLSIRRPPHMTHQPPFIALTVAADCLMEY